MKFSSKHATLAGTAILLATFIAGHANAGCTYDYPMDSTTSGWLQQQAIPPSDAQSRALGLALSSASPAASNTPDPASRTLVGLWKFTFVSRGTDGIPDGTVLDAGFVTWHSDGTEITNSSRPPKSGNFCMGVYKQTGRATFKLNHVGLSWDPTGVAFVGPANIREVVTLDRSGNYYSGTFTIDQFAQDGTTLLAHLMGKVSATRITAD